MFRNLFGLGRKADPKISASLYEAIVAAARQPEFYAQAGVPDIALGRFEMMTLHMVLFLRRIRDEEGELKLIGQTLTDDFFTDVDHSLRELGIGDGGVPKRVKKLARMFYGRAKSYTDALDGNDPVELQTALTRNIMPDSPTWIGSLAVSSYMMQASHVLASQSSEEIASGRLHFPQFSSVVQNEVVS